MSQYDEVDLQLSRREAVRAAIEVGAAAGFGPSHPVVLQDSNNVVVWLSPHDVVAKVGRWPHSAEVLGREVEVCAHLATAGAPIAAPIGGLRLAPTMALPVSLWKRLEPLPDVQVSDVELAEMLRRVHAGLSSYAVQLPSYLVAMDLARATLFDDGQTGSLPRADLDLLRGAFDRWAGMAPTWSASHRPLHGEPHLGNVVSTKDGPMLVDFEAASVGPVEWDLASMAPGVARAYGEFDPDLLVLLRRLNSARVATWCWALADHPSMRAYGVEHLAIVRQAAAAEASG